MPAFDQVFLDTQRLQLRPLKQSDAGDLFAIHSDAQVMRYSSMVPWASVDQAHALIERDIRGMPEGKYLCLGIVPRSEGRVVGTCTLFDIVLSSRRAEVGFALGSFAWGRGYMHEALSGLLAYCFTDLGLNRIEADIDPRNGASAKTLRRQGFKQEGLLRERWIVGGEVSDTAMYGLLRAEWESGP